MIVLNDNKDNCRDATEVKEVSFLNSDGLSVFAGRFPAWVKIASLRVPLMEDLIHLNIAVEFYFARMSVLATSAVATSASDTE